MPWVFILKHIATPAPGTFTQKEIEDAGLVFRVRHINIVNLMKRYRFHIFTF